MRRRVGVQRGEGRRTLHEGRHRRDCRLHRRIALGYVGGVIRLGVERLQSRLRRRRGERLVRFRRHRLLFCGLLSLVTLYVVFRLGPVLVLIITG